MIQQSTHCTVGKTWKGMTGWELSFISALKPPKVVFSEALPKSMLAQYCSRPLQTIILCWLDSKDIILLLIWQDPKLPLQVFFKYVQFHVPDVGIIPRVGKEQLCPRRLLWGATDNWRITHPPLGRDDSALQTGNMTQLEDEGQKHFYSTYF